MDFSLQSFELEGEPTNDRNEPLTNLAPVRCARVGGGCGGDGTGKVGARGIANFGQSKFAQHKVWSNQVRPIPIWARFCFQGREGEGREEGGGFEVRAAGLGPVRGRVGRVGGGSGGALQGPKFHLFFPHTTTRELQTCTFEGPGASNTTKIPREGKSAKIGTGEATLGCWVAPLVGWVAPVRQGLSEGVRKGG